MTEIPESDMTFIKKLAYKYFSKSNYYIELDDLIQEGVLAYLEAKKRYNKDKNDYFMGFAYLRVSGAMKDYIGKNSPRGSSTVRSSVKSDKFINNMGSFGVDADDFYSKTDDDIMEVIEKEEFEKIFYEFLKNITPMEAYILYKYFIQNASMTSLSTELSINRVKIKNIISNLVSYLGDKYGLFQDKK